MLFWIGQIYFIRLPVINFYRTFVGMETTIKMTTVEYAKVRGITIQAVSKRIREGKPLKDVLMIERFGRFYLLTVRKDFAA